MPWRLSLLTYGVTPRLHTMLLTKYSLKASPLLKFAKTTRRGNSGTPSDHGCASQPISEASGTQYPSYKSSLTMSARVSLRPITSPSTNEAWNNTSAPWDRSSRPWGPLTQESTTWAQSTFAWDDSLRHARKKYPSPRRVFPLPVSILHFMDSVASSSSQREKAIIDLAWIAFFFLIRPGEYCAGKTDNVSTPLQPAQHPVHCAKSTHRCPRNMT